MSTVDASSSVDGNDSIVSSKDGSGKSKSKTKSKPKRKFGKNKTEQLDANKTKLLDTIVKENEKEKENDSGNVKTTSVANVNSTANTTNSNLIKKLGKPLNMFRDIRAVPSSTTLFEKDPKYRQFNSQFEALKNVNIGNLGSSSSGNVNGGGSVSDKFKDSVKSKKSFNQTCDKCEKTYKTLRNFNVCKPKNKKKLDKVTKNAKGATKNAKGSSKRLRATATDNEDCDNDPTTTAATTTVNGSVIEKSKFESLTASETGNDEDRYDADVADDDETPTNVTENRSRWMSEFNFDSPSFKHMHKINLLGDEKHSIEVHETYACKAAQCIDYKKELSGVRQNLSKLIASIQNELKKNASNLSKFEVSKLKMRLKFARAYKQIKLAEYSYSTSKIKTFKIKLDKIFNSKVNAKNGVESNRVTVNDISAALTAIGRTEPSLEDLKTIACSLEHYITLITLSIWLTGINKRTSRVTKSNISSIIALQYAMNNDKESHPIPSFNSFKIPSDGKLNIIMCRTVLDLCKIYEIDDVISILFNEFDGDLKNLWVKFLFNFKPSSDYLKVIKDLYLKYLLASHLALCRMDEKRSQNKSATFRSCMAQVINNCTWFPFKEYANHTDVNLDHYVDNLLKTFDLNHEKVKKKRNSTTTTTATKRKATQSSKSGNCKRLRKEPVSEEFVVDRDDSIVSSTMASSVVGIVSSTMASSVVDDY